MIQNIYEKVLNEYGVTLIFFFFSISKNILSKLDLVGFA
jgi:hypothetical protein